MQLGWEGGKICVGKKHGHLTKWSFPRLQSALLCHQGPPAPAQPALDSQDPSHMAPESLNSSLSLGLGLRGPAALHLHENSSRLSLDAKVSLSFADRCPRNYLNLLILLPETLR